MYKRRFHVFMGQQGEGSSGGETGSNAGAGGGAGAGGAAGGVAASGGADSQSGSVLAAGNTGGAGGSGAAGTGGAAAGPHDWLPEKHRVFAQDGATLDLEASARKVADAYRHAEQRIGSGDVAPGAATDYKVTVPEALAGKINAEELAKTDDFKGFLGKMHGLGLSQKQLDGVTAELLERGVKMQEALPVMAQAECEATLRKSDGWTSDTEYAANLGRAFTAAKAYAGADLDGILKDFGNEPRIVRMLARVGAELAEDTQPSPEAQAQLNDSLDSAMSDPAYLNANDPRHAAQVAKVNALQAKVAGTKNVAAGRTMTFKTG